MCGIAGAFVYDAEAARLGCLKAAVMASASRGEDAFGVVRWSPSTGFRRIFRQGRYAGDWMKEIGEPIPGELTAYLHTSRAEPTTEWRKEKRDIDVPPFVDKGIAVAHNGIIANDSMLADEYGLERISHIDTAVVPALVAQIGVWKAVAALTGGMALAVFNSQDRSLVLCRNFMPLVTAWLPGVVTFASEAAFFPEADKPFREYQQWDLPPFSSIEISEHGFRGPIPWGQSPEESSSTAWTHFPSLCWRSNG
jgi:7-cyano-7-deazaguanine synthase